MNCILPQIFICAQLNISLIFLKKKNINLFKSIALHEEKVSMIKKHNLNLKNLFSELGIFLIEK